MHVRSQSSDSHVTRGHGPKMNGKDRQTKASFLSSGRVRQQSKRERERRKLGEEEGTESNAMKERQCPHSVWYRSDNNRSEERFRVGEEKIKTRTVCRCTASSQCDRIGNKTQVTPWEGAVSALLNNPLSHRESGLKGRGKGSSGERDEVTMKVKRRGRGDQRPKFFSEMLRIEEGGG